MPITLRPCPASFTNSPEHDEGKPGRRRPCADGESSRCVSSGADSPGSGQAKLWRGGEKPRRRRSSTGTADKWLLPMAETESSSLTIDLRRDEEPI